MAHRLRAGCNRRSAQGVGFTANRLASTWGCLMALLNGSDGPFSASGPNPGPGHGHAAGWQRVSTSAAVIIAYFLCSISLTFFQKQVVQVSRNRKVDFIGSHFPAECFSLQDHTFPITIVLCHLIMKFTFALAFRSFYSWYTSKSRVTLSWGVYLRRISGIAAASAFDIGLSQWGLEFVTVTLYTMTKSSSILFILFFSVIFKLEQWVSFASFNTDKRVIGKLLNGVQTNLSYFFILEYLSARHNVGHWRWFIPLRLPIHAISPIWFYFMSDCFIYEWCPMDHQPEGGSKKSIGTVSSHRYDLSYSASNDPVHLAALSFLRR